MKRARTRSDGNGATPARGARQGSASPQAARASAALGLASGLALAAVAIAPEAAARGVIREVGNHPDYSLDLEFHFGVSLLQGQFPNSGTGFGPGARLTVPVMHNGFVQTINNSIAVGVGFDWIHFGSFDTEAVDDFFIPIVLQWNFWLTEQWSVFGEPGFAPLLRTQDRSTVTGVINGGARWLISENFTVMFRAGYPISSIGISFMQ